MKLGKNYNVGLTQVSGMEIEGKNKLEGTKRE